MRIVDAHHHIWRRADLPWLLGPTRPRIFGPYDALKRDYPIAEYLADIEGTGVEKSVYVQANWAPNWALDEVTYVAAAHEATGWPHAVVAFADVTRDPRPALDRLAAQPLVRGIRHQMHWHENALYRFAPSATTVGSDAVIEGVGRLADYGFAFELQVFAGQVDAALRLVEACPRVTFVLQHAGMPDDLSEDGRASWREAVGRLAAHGNVVCKLSGFGTFLHCVEAQHIAWAVGEGLALFGPERCLFGSNFPIEKMWTGYSDLIDAFLRATHDLDEESRQSVFHVTAERVYGL